MTKTALITGITGQDGSYLAELLLEQGYRVVGMTRRIEHRHRSSASPTSSTGSSSCRATSSTRTRSPRRCARPSRTRSTTSPPSRSCRRRWNQPVLTGEFTGLGVTRLLEAIRQVDPGIRFYQASSSEMFGKVPRRPSTS